MTVAEIQALLANMPADAIVKMAQSGLTWKDVDGVFLSVHGSVLLVENRHYVHYDSPEEKSHTTTKKPVVWCLQDLL